MRKYEKRKQNLLDFYYLDFGFWKFTFYWKNVKKSDDDG